jgi:hypothetical protein
MNHSNKQKTHCSLDGRNFVHETNENGLFFARGAWPALALPLQNQPISGQHIVKAIPARIIALPKIWRA